jgi:hypothetical protein
VARSKSKHVRVRNKRALKKRRHYDRKKKASR